MPSVNPHHHRWYLTFKAHEETLNIIVLTLPMSEASARMLASRYVEQFGDVYVTIKSCLRFARQRNK